MYTKHPDGSIECSTCIKAIDLIKLANQIYHDNMQYVKISVLFPGSDDGDELVNFFAISSPTSDDVKKYPSIVGNSLIDFDEDLL